MKPIALLPVPGTHADIESLATIAGVPAAQINRNLRAGGVLTITPRDAEHDRDIRVSAERFGFRLASDEESFNAALFQAYAGEEEGAPHADESSLDAASLWAAAARERTLHPLDATASTNQADPEVTETPPRAGPGPQAARDAEAAAPVAFALPEVNLTESSGSPGPTPAEEENGWPRPLLAFAAAASTAVVVAVAVLLYPSNDQLAPSELSESRATGAGEEVDPGATGTRETVEQHLVDAPAADSTTLETMPRGTSTEGPQGRRRAETLPSPLVRGLLLEGEEACDEHDWDRCLRLAERALALDERSRGAMALRIRAMAGQSEDAVLDGELSGSPVEGEPEQP